MGQRAVRSPWLSDEVSTTDATVTTSTNCQFTVPAGASGHCDLTINAINTTTNVGCSLTKRICFANNAGTVTVQGAILALAAAIGDATLVAGLAVDANIQSGKVSPRVTGIVATNLRWLISAEYFVN